MAKFYLGGGSRDVLFRQPTQSQMLERYDSRQHTWRPFCRYNQQQFLQEITPDEAQQEVQYLGVSATEAHRAVFG